MLAHKTTTRATVKRYGVIVNPVADPPAAQRDIAPRAAAVASADCCFRAETQIVNLLASAVTDRPGTGLV